jgi:ABC-type transport system involved in multi-copper enzyme maturation permease subunit
MKNQTLQAQPDVRRVAPIALGHSDYLSVLWRLIGMELYKVRRRLLSKILLLLGTGLIVLLFVTLGIGALHYQSEPVTSFVPDSCARFPLNPECINHPATLADMRHAKQLALNGVALLLNMPGSWEVIVVYSLGLFSVLAIVLAGTLVGGEYSLGTVRLMFTRGPTRIQFLLAKIGVLLIYLVPAILFWILLGTGIGAVMAHVAGIGAGWSFLTSAEFGHFLLFALLVILYCFAYMMMALFFGTVGRSTVAAIVAPLIWLGAEPVVGRIITALVGDNTGGLADFIRAIPTYFLGPNLSLLLHDQQHALGVALPDPSDYSAGHSILVVAGYVIAFVGISALLTVRRDITN